jgi:hypothetical protein
MPGADRSFEGSFAPLRMTMGNMMDDRGEDDRTIERNMMNDRTSRVQETGS